MNRIFEAALEVDQFCRAKSWPFCIIGGVAVQRWGEPGGTQDVDLTVVAGFGGEEAFVDALLELKGAPEAATRLREILRKAQ